MAWSLLTADLFKDEHPQHRVRITKPFYLGTYHVTRGQFHQFVKDSGYKTDAEKGDKPGAWGWDPEKKTLAFNERLLVAERRFQADRRAPGGQRNLERRGGVLQVAQRQGRQRTYRLPTEAEWEYACRAGTTTRYYSGDDPETLAKIGNVADAAAKAKFPHWKWTIKASDGYVFTAPVGKFKPNVFGLYDMHGNAWQWCADWYGIDYYGKSPAGDPDGPDTEDGRVLRGGSWDAGRSTPVPPLATGARRTPGTASRVSGLPGLSNAMASGRVTVCGLTIEGQFQPRGLQSSDEHPLAEGIPRRHHGL